MIEHRLGIKIYIIIEVDRYKSLTAHLESTKTDRSKVLKSILLSVIYQIMMTLEHIVWASRTCTCTWSYKPLVIKFHTCPSACKNFFWPSHLHNRADQGNWWPDTTPQMKSSAHSTVVFYVNARSYHAHWTLIYQECRCVMIMLIKHVKLTFTLVTTTW